MQKVILTLDKIIFMSIQLDKELIIQEIKEFEEEWVLRAIRRILHHNDEVDIERYNKELDEAEKEIRNGDFVLHEDLKKRMEGW